MGATPSLISVNQKTCGFVFDDQVTLGLKTIASTSASDEKLIGQLNATTAFVRGLFPLTSKGEVTAGEQRTHATDAWAALESKLRSMLLQCEHEQIQEVPSHCSLPSCQMLDLWSNFLAQLMGTDPWRDVALSDQLNKLDGEELRRVELNEGDTLCDAVSANEWNSNSKFDWQADRS
jgi:hypothetical protein